ncbi:unnamed protein product, partial [marine sediment metagenome]
TLAEIEPLIRDPETQAVILYGHGTYRQVWLGGNVYVRTTEIRSWLTNRDAPLHVIADTCDAMDYTDLLTDNWVSAFSKGDLSNITIMGPFNAGSSTGSGYYRAMSEYWEMYAKRGYPVYEAYQMALQHVPEAAQYFRFVGNTNMNIQEGPFTKYYFDICKDLIEPCPPNREVQILGEPSDPPPDLEFNCIPQPSVLESIFTPIDVAGLHQEDMVFLGLISMKDMAAGAYQCTFSWNTPDGFRREERPEVIVPEGGQLYEYVLASLIPG